MKEPEILEWIRQNPPQPSPDDAVAAQEEQDDQIPSEVDEASEQPLIASDEVPAEPVEEPAPAEDLQVQPAVQEAEVEAVEEQESAIAAEEENPAGEEVDGPIPGKE